MIKQLLNLVYGLLHLKCITKQLLDSVFVICKIINVSVRVISLAFGSADNTYLGIGNSAYHKNLIQLLFNIGTHVKISQLVASLQTSRQQVVFARLVTSCQQVWNKLLTTCNNLVDIIRLVTRLFQQACYNHDITILLQPCVVNLVTFLLYHNCIKLVRTTL